jgi:hypothetical protein
VLYPAELRDRFSQITAYHIGGGERPCNTGTFGHHRDIIRTAIASSTAPKHTLRQGSNHGGRTRIALLAALGMGGVWIVMEYLHQKAAKPTVEDASRTALNRIDRPSAHA